MTEKFDPTGDAPQHSLLKQLGVDLKGSAPAVIPAYNIPYLPMM